MSISFGCCVLSGRELCVDLITSPGDSYRVLHVIVSVNLKKVEIMAHVGPQRHRGTKNCFRFSKFRVKVASTPLSLQ